MTTKVLTPSWKVAVQSFQKALCSQALAAQRHLEHLVGHSKQYRGDPQDTPNADIEKLVLHFPCGMWMNKTKAIFNQAMKAMKAI